MANKALKVIDNDEPMVMVQPGIVRLGEGKIRVTFDIPEFEMCVIRRDRQIKVEYDQFTPEGLGKQFLYGARFYNDAAGAAGKVDDVDEKGNKYYANKEAFLDACKAKALLAYDNIRLGLFNKGRETIGDPVEREMLKLGFGQFAQRGWTINNSPNEKGEMTKCADYKVFKTRVEAFVAKFDKIIRPQATANVEMAKEMEKEIEEAAKEVVI